MPLPNRKVKIGESEITDMWLGEPYIDESPEDKESLNISYSLPPITQYFRINFHPISLTPIVNNDL